MAVIHRAQLHPSKLELVSGWLPGRPWHAGAARPSLEQVGSFRFDDPGGEVGLETLLVRADGGPVLQVPLTYRGAPLDGADRWLVGTLEHSVLGRRWAYDACGDPVYRAVVVATMASGGAGAVETFEVDGQVHERQTAATVRGSGGDLLTDVVHGEPRDEADRTVVRAGGLELVVRRVLDAGAGDTTNGPDDAADGSTVTTLTGTWPGGPPEVLLVTARRA